MTFIPSPNEVSKSPRSLILSFMNGQELKLGRIYYQAGR